MDNSFMIQIKYSLKYLFDHFCNILLTKMLADKYFFEQLASLTEF